MPDDYELRPKGKRNRENRFPGDPFHYVSTSFDARGNRLLDHTTINTLTYRQLR